jgi:photosystem II stability/assembly factor-like uncharacterized protein
MVPAMFINRHPFRARLFLITGTLLIIASCNSSNDTAAPTQNEPPPGNQTNPPDAPAFVVVVAGDDDSGDIQNTVSWTRNPDATGFTVYWDNASGVTSNSSIVVPTASGTNYVVHSGVDVLAGNSYYYRVQAESADGASALSDEAAGTPQQSITNNALNDIAWNGTDRLVAVGDSGVILASPNGTADGWIDVAAADVAQQLTGVTWEGVNAQFLIVGAGSVVLSGDGSTWTQQDLGNLPGAVNLQDVKWLGDRYIAVGNNGAILTSNIDGSIWDAQDAGEIVANTAFNAVAASDNIIVVVGSNGTILTSDDAVAWSEQPTRTNNDLNDVTWDGSQFVVVGSNDTILTSPDGMVWTSHLPGTADINFVAVTQWDSGLPATAVVAAVGSSGTFVIYPNADPGAVVHTGTNAQLAGLAWVEDGIGNPYFVMVGHDGTVLSAQVP